MRGTLATAAGCEVIGLRMKIPSREKLPMKTYRHRARATGENLF